MKRVMKRALADRAKMDYTSGGSASSPPSEGLAISAPSNTALLNGLVVNNSSPVEVQPPLKLQRLASEDPSVGMEANSSTHSTESAPAPPVRSNGNLSISSNSIGSVPTSPQPTTRPDPSRSNSTTPPSNKRPRREASSGQSQQSDQEEDTSSAFYLKHQNRALAIELKSLQAQVRDLVEEREYRRRSCLQAVQSLHSLQATWTSLETALGQESPALSNDSFSPERGMPSSTVGNSDDTAVEWTHALQRALQALGNHSRRPNPQNNDDRDDSELPSFRGEIKLGELAANVTGRANCLQGWLWELLRSKQTNEAGKERTIKFEESFSSQDGEKTKCISELELLRSQLVEVTQSRDDFSSRERRLRRNIYRLDVGMISQKQLIQSVIGNGDQINDDPDRLVVQKEAILRGTTHTSNPADKRLEETVTSLATNTTEGDGDNSTPSIFASDLQRELEESRQAISNRDKSIEDLSNKIRVLEKRVTDLSVKQQSEGDKEKLESFESTSRKLEVAEKQIKELTAKLEKTREKWAQSVGNEKTAMKSLEELQDKHQKKWGELAASEGLVNENGEIPHGDVQARKIAELEHKLCQALENVRQAETARTNLREALEMNESLKTSLDELKAKGSSEKPEKGDRASSKSQSSDNHATPSSSRSESHSGSGGGHHRERERESGSDRISAEKAEKLYRENKKMRKEIAAIMASKEGHKSKLERVEKERNALADTNIRLMKQVTEKDEMNAKSLSSILHLKGLTEQLTQERKILEDEVKSAEQLALAARLTSNAKERLGEELAKEKAALEQELRDLEQTHLETKKELNQKIAECADASGKSASVNAELAHALQRCDEFVAQTEEQGGEIRKLLDALNKAERVAKESREKLSEMVKNSASSDSSSGSTGGFTADQLKTQIQVLKNRLACPVCHYRDKECIIMRCRHMHCKHCVEERLNNRSRRCPTCNNPFGKTDVEDIFLG